uniref:Uncharacterized protein n=1 Tax=Anopheles dirus TaxID=7168 RepID=A0A182NT93_9DIPT
MFQDVSVLGAVQFGCVFWLVNWLVLLLVHSIAINERRTMDKLKGKLKMKSVVQKVMMDTGDDRELAFEDVARLILNAYEEEAHAKEEAFFKFFQKLLLEDENFVGQLQPQDQAGSRQQTAVHLVASRQTGTATAILRALLTAAGKDIRTKTDGVSIPNSASGWSEQTRLASIGDP